MEYRDVCGERVSRLGLGMMRLPLDESGAIDEAQVFEMVDCCLGHGVNYFDTAYPYHGGMSEVVTGKALARHPRESFRLASKYPGHQIADEYDPADIFEEQLRKCGVDYFDFYLLHNVYERSLPVYLDDRWGIVEYFERQRELGRIRHLGFSTHGGLDCMRAFLDVAGDAMEFCQIQMNYLDWTLQRAEAKAELCREHGLDIIVMEPMRGGMLATLDSEAAGLLEAAAPGRSAAEWALRWQLGKPGDIVLSGASNMEQLAENIMLFEKGVALSSKENELLGRVSELMKNSVPCTACRYCVDSCPVGLDIPYLMELANEIRVAPSFNAGMRIDALPPEKRPSMCLACNMCAMMCPQKIRIPKVLIEMDKAMANVPHWDDLCRERAEAAAKLKEQMSQAR